MSERLRSVVEQLGVRPDARVLDIGCGHGGAATFVCEGLEEGHLTAVDRHPVGHRPQVGAVLLELLSQKAVFVLGRILPSRYGVIEVVMNETWPT